MDKMRETYEQAETPTQIFLHCIGRLTGTA